MGLLTYLDYDVAIFEVAPIQKKSFLCRSHVSVLDISGSVKLASVVAVQSRHTCDLTKRAKVPQ